MAYTVEVGFYELARDQQKKFIKGEVDKMRSAVLDLLKQYSIICKPTHQIPDILGKYTRFLIKMFFVTILISIRE